ncbi:MAG TPA: acyl-CoA dehydrogenase family protein, partial [Nocardioidaceae bacterium]|nr:acyl-CoA dehydrogenase family protein [Nocardioidaceae bacterium]
QTRIATDDAAETRAEVRALLAEVGSNRVKLAEAGLITPHWPAPYGRGASAIEQLVIDEEFAAAAIERPDLVIGAWALPPILEHGTDDQRERFVAPTLRGDIEWCQLFSEPGAGSDLASLRTKAVRDGDGWRLTGQKVWTSRGHVSDWGICLARTNPDAKPHKGITYFLVDMRSEGIEIRPLRTLTGDALFNEVFLDDVFVPDDCVVGEVDHGWPLARTTLANERVAISGSSLGVSVELALSLAGEAPGEVLRLRLGEAVAAAATSKALGLRATLRTITGQGPGSESSVQKLVGVAQRQNAAELAFTLLEQDVLLGGEHSAQAINEALVTRCLSIAGGTTQVLRNVVAERILGLPRD